MRFETDRLNDSGIGFFSNSSSNWNMKLVTLANGVQLDGHQLDLSKREQAQNNNDTPSIMKLNNEPVRISCILCC